MTVHTAAHQILQAVDRVVVMRPEEDPGSPTPTRLLWRSVRGPVVACCTALALYLAAILLDRLPPGAGRETALLLGGPAITVLLPVSILWLAAALLLHWRRCRHLRIEQKRQLLAPPNDK